MSINLNFQILEIFMFSDYQTFKFWVWPHSNEALLSSPNLCILHVVFPLQYACLMLIALLIHSISGCPLANTHKSLTRQSKSPPTTPPYKKG